MNFHSVYVRNLQCIWKDILRPNGTRAKENAMSDPSSAVHQAQADGWNRADTLLVCGSLAVGIGFLMLLVALR